MARFFNGLDIAAKSGFDQLDGQCRCFQRRDEQVRHDHCLAIEESVFPPGFAIIPLGGTLRPAIKAGKRRTCDLSFPLMVGMAAWDAGCFGWCKKRANWHRF